MRAANSAAQVSTVWNTGRIPSACLQPAYLVLAGAGYLGDLGVGEPLGEQAQHLELAGRQPERRG